MPKHSEKLPRGGAIEPAFSRQNPAETPKRLAFNLSDRCPYTEEELAYYRKYTLENPFLGDLIDPKLYSPASKRSRLRTVLRNDLMKASQKASEKAERQFLLDSAQNEKHQDIWGEKVPGRLMTFHPGNVHPDDSFKNSSQDRILDSNQVGLGLLSSEFASLSMCPDCPTRLSSESDSPANVRLKSSIVLDRQPFLQTGLGKVPPEIREIIWEYVLISQLAVKVGDFPPKLSAGGGSAVKKQKGSRCAATSSPRVFKGPALLLVCRRIHKEAQYIMDNKNTYLTDLSGLLAFLKKLGPIRRGNIRSLHLSKDEYLTKGSPKLPWEANGAAPVFKDCRGLYKIVFDAEVGAEMNITFFLLLIHICLYPYEEGSVLGCDDNHTRIYHCMSNHRTSGHKGSWLSLFSPIYDNVIWDHSEYGNDCRIEVEFRKDGHIYFRYVAIDETL